MNNNILNYLADHPKYNAISCASLLSFIINLDLNQIVTTMVLSVIGALSGYLATMTLEKILKANKVRGKR